MKKHIIRLVVLYGLAVVVMMLGVWFRMQQFSFASGTMIAGIVLHLASMGYLCYTLYYAYKRCND